MFNQEPKSYKLHFLTSLIMIFILLIILWKNSYSNKQNLRAKYLPLIMALEAHKERTGEYPLKLKEIHSTLPKFNLSRYEGIDKRSENCLTTDDIYCKNEDNIYKGHYTISERYNIDLGCTFILGSSTDFECHK